MAALNSQDTGGYDVDFVENVCPNVDDVKCAICLLILREPLQANPCGHRFCKSCIERIPGYGTENDLICPSDRRNIKVFPDVGKEREILNLQVKCSSHEFSCTWTGELRNLEDHIQSCPHATFPCRYSPLGCKTEGNRESIATHLKDDIENHLTLQMEKILRQDDTIKQQEIEIAQQRETLGHQGEVISGLMAEVKSISVFFARCPFTFTIDNFQSKFASSKTNNDIIYSDSFYYLNGYRARLKVYLNGKNAVQGSHFSVYFQIMKGVFDETLEWPMVFGLIKIALIINEKCKHKMAINCKEDKEDLKTRFTKPWREEGESYGTVKYFAHRDLPAEIYCDQVKLVVNVTKI